MCSLAKPQHIYLPRAQFLFDSVQWPTLLAQAPPSMSVGELHRCAPTPTEPSIQWCLDDKVEADEL